MMQLWFHFMTDKGQAVNIIRVMDKDFEVSEYILTKYPNELVALLSSATSIINGANLKTMSGIESFAKSLEKLKHPAKVFNHSYLGGKPYFGPMGLEEVSKNSRKPVVVNGTSFHALAELASSIVIKEKGSASHTAKKVLSQVPSLGSVANLFARDFSMSDEDIRKLINYGKDYLKNIKKFMGEEQKVLAAAEDLRKALARLLDKTKDITGQEERAARGVVVHAEAYASNIIHCLTSPAVQEISRSLKTARYCGYLAKRMNWNSK